MRSWHLFLVILINALIQLQYAVLTPILPLEIKRRAIPQIATGIILSCYSLPFLVLPPFIQKYVLPRVGRRRTFQRGVLLLSVA